MITIIFISLYLLVIFAGYALYQSYMDMPSYDDEFDQIEDVVVRSEVALIVLFVLCLLPILYYAV